MITYLKTLLKPPTIHTIVTKELYETRVGLLSAQANLEYQTSMVTYYNAKLRRLESTKPWGSNQLLERGNVNTKTIVAAVSLFLAAVAAQGNDRPNLNPTSTECLAAAIYKEARGESIRGRLAVAQVVLNRGEPCVVVNQPGQFSWRRTDRLNWDNTSLYLANRIITRGYAIKGFKATHFHNLQVNPNWSGYITTIGAHKFYYSPWA